MQNVAETQVLDNGRLDRREWQRLLAAGDCRVGVSVGAGTSQPAVVKDVSIAGIAVIVDGGGNTGVDLPAEIQLGTQRIGASVKSVVPLEGGPYRLGLYWTEPKIGSILSLMNETQDPSQNPDVEDTSPRAE